MKITAANLPRRERSAAGVWNCKLLELRHRYGHTQKAVAEAVGIAASTLSILEAGGEPTLTTAYRLARFYGAEIEAIWSGGAC